MAQCWVKKCAVITSFFFPGVVTLIFFISLVLPKPIINLLYVFQHLYFVPNSKYPTCLNALVFSPLWDIISGAFSTFAPIWSDCPGLVLPPLPTTVDVFSLEVSSFCRRTYSRGSQGNNSLEVIWIPAFLKMSLSLPLTNSLGTEVWARVSFLVDVSTAYCDSLFWLLRWVSLWCCLLRF